MVRQSRKHRIACAVEDDVDAVSGKDVKDHDDNAGEKKGDDEQRNFDSNQYFPNFEVTPCPLRLSSTKVWLITKIPGEVSVKVISAMTWPFSSLYEILVSVMIITTTQSKLAE